MNKAKIRLLVSLFWILGIAFAWAGGGKEERPQVITPATVVQPEVTPNRIGRADAPMKLTFATIQSLSHQANDNVKEHLLKAFTQWASKNTQVQIEVSLMAGPPNETMAKLLEQAAGGRAPDLAMVDSFFAPRFYEFLQPLDEYIPPSEVNDWIDFAKNRMVDKNGRLKLLWITTDVIALYYRKDLIPKPPKTWEEVIEIGKKMTSQNMIGFIFPAGRAEAALMAILPMFYAQGGELIDETGRPVFNEGQNRELLLEIFRFQRKLIELGVAPSWVTTKARWIDFYPELGAGNVAMFIGGSWIDGILPKLLGDSEKAFRYAVTELPMKDATISPMTACGGWTAGVFTTDKSKIKVAVDFLQSCYSGYEGMAGLIAGGNLLPPRKSVANYDAPYFKSPNFQVFSKMAERGRPRPSALIYPTVSVQLQIAISETVSGRKTPEDALISAWEHVMKEYGKK